MHTKGNPKPSFSTSPMFSIVFGFNENCWWLYTLRTEDGFLLSCVRCCSSRWSDKDYQGQVCPIRPEAIGLFQVMGRGPAWRRCVPHQHPGFKKTHQKNLNTLSASEVQDAFSGNEHESSA